MDVNIAFFVIIGLFIAVVFLAVALVFCVHKILDLKSENKKLKSNVELLRKRAQGTLL